LKAGEWFRRGRLLMVSPVHGDYRRCQAEIPLIVLFRFPGPALTITLSRPNGEVGSGYNVIVGENNTGKSTVVTTARYLLSQDASVTIGKEARHAPEKPIIEIVWEDSEGPEHIAIDPNVDGAIFQKTGNRSRAQGKFRFVPSRRPFGSEYNTQGLSATDYESNEFINRLANQSYFDGQLASTVASFFTNPQNKSLFLEKLKAVDPHSTQFSTDNVATKNVLLYQGPSKRTHVISDTGDGITNLIRIIYSLVTSEPGNCIVVDEPELSLHPQLQRNLYKLLLSYSTDRQIVVVAHSPHYVGWKEISGPSRLFRVFIGSDGNSQIVSPSHASFNAVKAHSNVMSRKYYDSLCKELFFSDRVVLLEGSEDVHYIENFLDATGQPPLPIMGYGCGGASVIRPWMRLCVDLGIRCAAIFDGDKKVEFDHAVAEFSEKPDMAHSFLLFKDDIRDKYQRTVSGAETNEVHREGVFRRDGVIHPENRANFEELVRQVRAFLDQ
jgi:energy-coupling factor transporter ATP-binding protein EcfA2